MKGIGFTFLAVLFAALVAVLASASEDLKKDGAAVGRSVSAPLVAFSE